MFENSSQPHSNERTETSRNQASAGSDTSSHQQSQFESYETYEEVLKDLYRWNIRSKELILAQGGVITPKSSLDNMRAVCSALGNPQDSYKVVHVAGTNGKGSVCLKTAAALQAAGFKTGLFTSPHISCFRERIRINGEMVSEESIVSHFNRVTQASVALSLPLTFFEITTLMAFLHYEVNECDVIVLEVGVGGRIDATNIVNPFVCAITSIGLDHVDALGHTIDEIAAHKAGIIKPGVEVVVGQEAPHHVFQRVAQSQDAPYLVAEGTRGVSFREQNEGIARAVVRQFLHKTGGQLEAYELASAQIQAVNQPCRMEKIDYSSNLTVYIDVCHNESGIEAVLRELKQAHPDKSIKVACAFSKMKEIEKMLQMLLAEVQQIHFLASPHFKLESISSLYEIAQQVAQRQSVLTNGVCGKLAPLIEGGDLIQTLNHVTQAQKTQGNQSSQSEEILLICGSFYIMEDVRKYFFGRENGESDPAAINHV